MTDQNNARETSGEAEIVERLREILSPRHLQPKTNELVAEVHALYAETINRLVSERDAAINEREVLAFKLNQSVNMVQPMLVNRAEAAEKELYATVRKLNCDDADQFWNAIAKMRTRAEAAEARIAELEAQNAQAMQALGHVRNLAELMMHGDVSYLNMILDIISATMKGKQP